MKNRVILLLIGTCLISFGIACMAKANIGMSPIASFPYVLWLEIPAISLGKWVLMWNIVFALLQIVVMGKEYKLYYLTQIPLAFLLGYCTDFAKYLMKEIPCNVYYISLLFMLIGVLLTALGVFFTVRADLIMNGPEAFIRGVASKCSIKFGTLKTIFDVSCMTIAIVASLFLFKRIEGVREGTIFAAVFTGIFVNMYTSVWKKIKKDK